MRFLFLYMETKNDFFWAVITEIIEYKTDDRFSFPFKHVTLVPSCLLDLLPLQTQVLKKIRHILRKVILFCSGISLQSEGNNSRRLVYISCTIAFSLPLLCIIVASKVLRGVVFPMSLITFPKTHPCGPGYVLQPKQWNPEGRYREWRWPIGWSYLTF